MSDLESIERILRRTARRRGWARAWEGLSRGIFWGALLGLVALGLFKLLPLPGWIVPTAWCFAGALALGWALVTWARRTTLQGTARWVDEQTHLQDRVSTAWEISRQTSTSSWQQLVVADAAAHLRGLDPHRLVRLRFPGPLRWALMFAALGVGLGFVPEYRSETFRRKQTETAFVREVGQRLAEATRQQLESHPPSLPPPTREALQSIADLGSFLAQAKLTRNEALQKLAAVVDRVRDQVPNVPPPAPLKAQAASEQASGPGAGSSPAVPKPADSKSTSPGQGVAPEKMENLEQRLQKLQQAASQLPPRDSPQGQAAREQLSQSLSDLARDARDLGAALPGLEDAIAALQKNQTDLMLRDLEAAMNDLEKLHQMAKSMQQLEQQATRLGKDLAEQLAQAQLEAAQHTLEKMIRQLQSASVPPEALERIQEEVSKAVDPAGEYGRAAEFLKQAIAQMQAEKSGSAAQSLTQAAEELAKLRQQMGEADGLLAAMNALEQAQMALASGRSWEKAQGMSCQACGGAGCTACRGRKGTRWSHGGGVGAGVGTWADESGWVYHPEDQQPVDNSGVIRPDLDSRGLTERPAELSSDLNPTKVRGQMSPGSSMPSITLKGVHLRGQSSARFEEVAAAAQAEAQSALSQDKVPRPYLNSVREYFDDLKRK